MMTFLNPLLLLGLVAAAIPILLHLFNLRKLRTIEFSTLAFLKELQKTKIRRLKIRQILLLLLRTLLVILLVLAFARPTLKGSMMGVLGTNAKSTLVLLVDDSYSMTASDEGGELLKQAKESVLGILELLKDGDEVFLVRLSEVNRPDQEERTVASRDFSLVRRSVEEMRPSYVHRKLDDALRFSAKLLARSTNYNKEIYLFSDFQSGLMAPHLDEKGAQEHLFPPEARIFFVRLGKRPVHNLGIESVTIPNSIFEQGRPFIVKVRITNHTDKPARSHVVSVFLNGTRVAQRSIDMQEGSQADAEFTVSASATGFVEGFAELEDDDLEFDNRRYFTVHIPEHVKLLLVGNPSDLRFIKLAFETRQSSGRSTFELEEVTPERIGSTQISTSNVILLAGPRGLSPAQVSQIASFLSDGGGLILFPGGELLPNDFTGTLSASLKLPSISGLDAMGKPQPPNESESFLEFDRTDVRHPVFQGMFEGGEWLAQSQQRNSKGPAIESPRVRTSARYALTPQSTEIISLSNGASFLVEHHSGDGRVLLFSVAANLEWSDFPLKGLFVPLLHQSVSYLAGEQSHQRTAISGDEFVVKSKRRNSTQWTIVNPEAIEAVTSPASTGLHRVVRFLDTEHVGIYTVKTREAILQKFAVNLDPDESRTTKATEQETEKMLDRIGVERGNVTTIEQRQEMHRVVMESRFGTELWKHLLFVALIIALVEMFVGRVGRRETSLS